MIEEWLLKNEEYTPKKKKNSFIDKSLTSFFNAISKFQNEPKIKNFLYYIDFRIKIILLILFILLISLSRNFIFTIIINILVFLEIFFFEEENKIKKICFSLVFPCGTLIVLLPEILSGNIYHSFLIVYKIFINILLVKTFSSNTSKNDSIKSLKIIFVPDIFIWSIELTIKYILLLSKYIVNILNALKIRSIGSNNKTEKSLFNIMGNIFLHSFKMSEEMIWAMECRGFTGEYTINKKLILKKIDYIAIFTNIFLIIIFILSKNKHF